MAFDNINSAQNLTSLVVHEIDPSSGYARRTIIIDDDSTATDIPMGLLVYRDIATSALGLDTAYTIFDKDNEWAETSNEGPNGEETGVAGLTGDYSFAVVFGDKYSAKDLWVSSGDGDNTAVGFVRGEVQLKAETVWAANSVTDGAMKKSIKALLERQGVILLESDSAAIS